MKNQPKEPAISDFCFDGDPLEEIQRYNIARVEFQRAMDEWYEEADFRYDQSREDAQIERE